MPAPVVAGGSQLRDGRLAVHSVAAPELNVTVPVAPPGSPEVESDTASPYEVELGVAEADMEVGSFVIVKLVPTDDPR
jgi:hypothetical protein